MDFKTWILQFKGQGNFFGDLAGEIGQDKHFPLNNNYETLTLYFHDTLARDTFEEAWKTYQSEVR